MEDVEATTTSSQPSVSCPSPLATSSTRSAPAPPTPPPRTSPPPNPPPPSREALVRTAVEFLLSPRVSTASEDKKRLFLKSKSLTDEEVETAVALASAAEAATVASAPATVSSPAAAASSLALRSVDDEEEWRRRDGAWSRRPSSSWPIGLTSTLVLLGGFSYGLYALYVHYVSPFLKRQKRVDEKLLWLEASTRDLRDNVALTLKTVQSTVEKLQASFDVRRESDSTTTTEMEANLRRNQTQLAAEVKSEIASLKKMLLNVDNFPSPSSRRATTTKIPSSLDEDEEKGSSPSAATTTTTAKTTIESSVLDEFAAAATTASPPAWQLEASIDDSSRENGVDAVVVATKTNLDDDDVVTCSESEPFLTSASIDATAVAKNNSDDAVVVDEKPPVVIVKEDVVRRSEQWSSGSSSSNGGSSSSSGTSATSFEVIETKDCGSSIASKKKKKSRLNAIHAESEGSDGDDDDEDDDHRNCSAEDDRVEIKEESERDEINTAVRNLIDDVLEKGSKDEGTEKEETNSADDAVRESEIN